MVAGEGGVEGPGRRSQDHKRSDGNEASILKSHKCRHIAQLRMGIKAVVVYWLSVTLPFWKRL